MALYLNTKHTVYIGGCTVLDRHDLSKKDCSPLKVAYVSPRSISIKLGMAGPGDGMEVFDNGFQDVSPAGHDTERWHSVPDILKLGC